MRFDLHIHSCLSPCADLDMSPRAIAYRACAAGLDAIALCDHNSARNTPALRERCAAEGIACLFGMEITTAEELHALAVFDTTEAALAMTEQIYAALPPRLNVPGVFGEQPVVNDNDEVTELEPRLLSAPTRLAVRDVAARVHALGGLFVASHVDRPFFSVASQLGKLSGDEGFEAMELTLRADHALWKQIFPGLPVLCSSDAHQLVDIGLAWNEADLPDFTVASLRAALQADAVRCVIPRRATESRWLDGSRTRGKP
jgi:PHP family Zn ribbon phosphoesterase